MKKSEKLDIISSAEGTYGICRCYFRYHPYYWYYYILGHSDKFMFGIEEFDFQLNGFQIRKISDLTKIELKDDLCAKINRDRQILQNVAVPDISLSSWYDIFISLTKAAEYFIIENEYDKRNGPYFYIGRIKKVKRSSVIILPFDADGIWLDETEIPFSEITSVTFGDRYSKTFGGYMERITGE